jgi:hypothetical protein
MLLMSFVYDGASDPEWHRLFARALYYQGRTADAVRHLEMLFEMLDDGERGSDKWADAAEMLDTCRSIVLEDTDRYTELQLYALKDHIDAYFGNISHIIPDDEPMGVNIDIAVTDPDEFHDYYTLVTIGMGACRMKLPGYFSQDRLERAELVMYMPSDWNPESRDIKDRWIIEQMRSIARLPKERGTWLGYGHLISNGMPISGGTKLSSVMIITVQDVSEDACRCFLPDDEDVVFYQLFPLYREESDYKMAYGTNALIEKMPHISAVYNPVRENVCEDYKPSESSPLMLEEADMLGDTDIGFHCAASRKILDDGCKVGFMKRIFFEEESDLSQNDSGWLFLSGSESQEYLSNPYNIELCSLNTVCNIDREIVPFITSPYGTEIARGIDGRLTVISENNDGEEPKSVFS